MLAKGCGIKSNPTVCFTKGGHCGTLITSYPSAACCWRTTPSRQRGAVTTSTTSTCIPGLYPPPRWVQAPRSRGEWRACCAQHRKALLGSMRGQQHCQSAVRGLAAAEASCPLPACHVSQAHPAPTQEEACATAAEAQAAPAAR